jgi:hypothetical protein
MCDREDKMKISRDQDRKHTISRAIKCSFSAIEIKNQDSDVEFLKMIKLNHNHFFTFVDAHSILRKMIIISEIKNDISRQLNVQISSAKVLFALRIFDSVNEVNFSNSEDSKILNLMFKI